MKVSWRLTALFLFLPLGAISAFSQQTGITGVVTDTQGAIILGAKVEVKQAGAASYAATTNSQGVYVVPGIPAAEYTITASSPNFGTAEKRVLVLVGQLAQVNLSLPVASSASQVVVEAGSEYAIDTTSSQVSGNITPEEVQDIPVNGRSYVELSSLVAGIKEQCVWKRPG